MSNTIQWEGKSGNSYRYWVNPVDTSFKDEPGNYIFAEEVEPGRWRPVYIGQTESLADRLDNHPKEDCAVRNGATHIHAHTNPSGEEARRTEEQDLIAKWQPACND